MLSNYTAAVPDIKKKWFLGFSDLISVSMQKQLVHYGSDRWDKTHEKYNCSSAWVYKAVNFFFCVTKKNLS